MRGVISSLFLLTFTDIWWLTSAQRWIEDRANVSLRKPKNGNITLGTEVAFKCDADGLPNPQIKWYKNKLRIVEDEAAGYRLSDPRLRILSVSAAHNGLYSCEAENEAGVAESGDSYLLNVRDPESAFLKDDLFTRTSVTVRDATVWMHCEFENAQEKRWYKGPESAERILNSTRSRTTVYANGTLQISEIRRADEGTYLCQGIGHNNVAQSFTAELRIAKLPRFNDDNLQPRIKSTKLLAAGDNFEVTCTRPKGIPLPTIKWQNSEGKQILTGTQVTVEGTKLIIDSANVGNTGNYTCLAENMAGRREKTIEIVVTVPPMITRAPNDTAVREGQLSQLHCGYNGTKPPWTRVIWLKDSKLIPQEMYDRNEVIVNQNTGTLTIDRSGLNMEGHYKCVLNTTQQVPVESPAIFLNVIKKLQFRIKPRSMPLELGSSANISCEAEAEVPPTITWVRSKNKHHLPENVSDDAGTLRFTNIQKEAAGSYMCVATVTDTLSRPHKSVAINVTISIQVGVSPSFIDEPQNQNVTVGEDAMIHCSAQGDPTPNVKWEKDGKLLDSNSSSHMQLENNSLLIFATQVSDDASYGCIVGNIRGFKRAVMKLNVVGNSTATRAKDVQPTGYQEQDKSIGITKTIVIAVCSSVAYLALVIGLVAFCSIRLMKKRQKLKLSKKANLELQKDVNHENPLETDHLMTGNSVTNGNGYAMHERHPKHDSLVLEDGERTAISQRSFQSNGSHPSKRPPPSVAIFDRNMLHNIGVLGHGMYGEVFLAKVANNKDGGEQLVCVKRLTSKDENIQMEFGLEADMFHKLNHDRICRLLAICKEMDPIYMLMEYCEWGDLKQFLIATGSSNGQELTIDPPDVSQKLSMCHQVASAMSYLSACRYVHKDLASRNILLEPSLNVKVSSLGLSKDIYASEYVQAKSGLLVPLRWTAPEAWLGDEYSTKSDVWSFGCFLYEVFSGAEIPYPDRTNAQVISGYESGEVAPNAGKEMPSSLQTVAYQCWSSSPRDRPDFNQIVTMFSSIRIDSRE